MLPLHVPHFARLSEYYGCWCIEPNAFRGLWEAAARMDMAAHVEEEQPPLKSQMEMVPARNGKSVAVVPVLGVMMKQRSSMGGTSTIQLRRDIRNAAADPNVSAIMLAIESPGGTTAGLDDLAAEVRAARKSKPVWAHVDDLTASAAYWIASQAERITANSPTALVGSIGTILTIYDQSVAAEREGIKALVFATGPLKGAGTPGSEVSPQQQAYFQGIVNGVQAEFDKAVRSGRKLSDAQLTEVRSGAVWKATEAQQKGLIDGIQPLSKTLDELARAADKSTPGRAAAVFPGVTLPAGSVMSPLQVVIPPGAQHLDIPSIQPAVRVARPNLENPMSFEQWLAAYVPGSDSLTAEQREKLHAAYVLQNTPAPPPPVLPAQVPVAQVAPVAQPVGTSGRSLDQITAAQTAENERVNGITEMAHAFMQEHPGNNIAVEFAGALAKQAIDQKWDLRETKLRFLQDGRNFYGNGGRINFVTSGKPEANGEILEAAICKTARLDHIEKYFDDRTLSAADKLFRGGLGIQDLVMHFARKNGCSAHSYKGNERSALRAAFHEGDYDIRAEMGPSTYSLPNILANVANKFVRAGFDAVDQTWRQFCSIRSVSDFKAISTFSLTGDNTYEQVAPGGEIKHGTLGETAYTNQANTYGKILGIDRRDIVNDDTGALTGASKRLGRGGALKLNDVIYTAFLNNSAFFTVGRGNADSGNDTLMDLTGLANAWGLFQLQTDPDSKPLGVKPALLLVPPALYPAAWTLTMSPELNLATSTAASTGTRSPWTGMFRLATTPYLANSSFTGYSAAAWYVLADPSDLPVIETVFLNGQETPTVETADMDFDRLGIALRGYHDFGSALQEYRGGVRMNGS